MILGNDIIGWGEGLGAAKLLLIKTILHTSCAVESNERLTGNLVLT